MTAPTPTPSATDTDDDGLLVLEGTITRVTFRNEDTGFSVARVDVEGGGTATVVGVLTEACEGLALRMSGGWDEDRRFGRQFRFASYRTVIPTTMVGLERYLGSGIVPGVGAELARRIVRHFGEATFTVIDETPGRLSEVPGIGEVRGAELASVISGQRATRDALVYLRGLGVGPATSAKIVKKFGEDTIDQVRSDPYQLTHGIWGIGWKTADDIALRSGTRRGDPQRIDAGILHALGESVEDGGHLHLTDGQLAALATGLLAVPKEAIHPRIAFLAKHDMVVREVLGRRGPCVMLPWVRDSEVEAAERLAVLCRTPCVDHHVLGDLDLSLALGRHEAEAGIALAEQQREAVEAALTHKCTVITGGPGVGKTTIVRAIVHLALDLGLRVKVAAPTGRAAKRLREAITRKPGADDAGEPEIPEATTIHRMLEFLPQEGGFQRNPGNPIDTDMVILDESSMIDQQLFCAILGATPPAARLVLVGDRDQLPSVGAGQVLADVIESGVVATIRLTQIFRQARESRIVLAAHAINSGDLPALGPPESPSLADEDQESDFYFVEQEEPEVVRDVVVDVVSEIIPARFGLDPVADVQVLVPIHRGDLGTVALNQALQARLNPMGPGRAELIRGDRVFRIGDRVMQLKNDYERHVHNGDVGRIVRIDARAGVVEVVLGGGKSAATAREAARREGRRGRAGDGRGSDGWPSSADGWPAREEDQDVGGHDAGPGGADADDDSAQDVVVYRRADLDQLVHAYAVSVHKSQGSEYPAVVLPVVTQHYMMLQRSLLYTAVTRGKKLTVVVGTRRALEMAIRNVESSRRNTWLAARLRERLDGRERI
jgi:exodeoxyribonuclease V alpha subunit